jgi:ABC-type multidrug transport system fused ATPase/permease subunit
MIPISTIIFPKYIIDELIGKQRIDYIVFYIVGLLLFRFAGGFLTDFLEGKIFVARGIVFNKFQCHISEKLLECDYENIENPNFLDIKERARKFLYANGQGFGVVLNSAFNILGNLFIFASIVVIISTLSVWVVLAFIGLVLLSTLVDSNVRKNYTKWDMEKAPIERKTSYLLNVSEDFSYGKDIRIYGAKDFLLQKISHHLELSNQFYKKQIKVLNQSKYFNSLMTLLRDGIAYSYLVFKVINNAVSIGDFSMYISAVSQFSSAMNELLQSILDIRQFSGYYDALEQYLNVPSKMREGEKRTDIDTKSLTIEFQDVSFRYAGQENYALRHVNIKIHPGEKIAIVGENGAGKTTFVKLLMRLYDPTDGCIQLNGVDIKSLDYDYYQSLIAVVFQDYKLFSFTIKENVDFGKEEDDKIITRKLNQIGLQDKLESLPKGIDTYIHKTFEEDGFDPSGGEGQKIAIARALYKDASIIILDEPTAALDPRAEYNIYQNFNQLIEGKTALYISHRMSSARFCDQILVFRKGVICENGTHLELMEANGLYRELYSMQSQYYV